LNTEVDYSDRAKVIARVAYNLAFQVHPLRSNLPPVVIPRAFFVATSYTRNALTLYVRRRLSGEFHDLKDYVADLRDDPEVDPKLRELSEDRDFRDWISVFDSVVDLAAELSPVDPKSIRDDIERKVLFLKADLNWRAPAADALKADAASAREFAISKKSAFLKTVGTVSPAAPLPEAVIEAFTDASEKRRNHRKAADEVKQIEKEIGALEIQLRSVRKPTGGKAYGSIPHIPG